MNITRALINEHDIAQMTKGLHSLHPRFGLLWQVGIATGLRVSDLLTLKLSHLANGSFSVKESKTGKWKHCQLSPELMSSVVSFGVRYRLKPEHYLFYRSDIRKQYPMSRQWVHRLITRTAKIRGLERIGSHSMRKIYACNLYRSTRSLDAVQAALNHAYPSTTMLYLKDLLTSVVLPPERSDADVQIQP